MGLVPMYLSFMYRIIKETHFGKPFTLQPTPSSVTLNQTVEFTNRIPEGNCFGIGDFPDFLKLHLKGLWLIANRLSNIVFDYRLLIEEDGRWMLMNGIKIYDTYYLLFKL